MPAKLPVISGREAARAFCKAGFVEQSGRGKGSHIVVVRSKPPCILTIPNHKELKRGTLRALLRDAGVTVEEFVGLV